jgi:hypothetical protein
MTRLRVSISAVLAVALVLGGMWAPAYAQPPGNAVTEWNRIAITTLLAFPGPAGGAPPAAQIHLGMVQGAVYDAVNAMEPKHYRPYVLKRRFSARGSRTAAVATAAHHVLSSIISGVPAAIAFPNRASLLASVDAAYAASLAGVANGSFKNQGVVAGNAAAQAMIAARQGDGRFGPSQWVSNSAAGHWQPLLNAQGAPIQDPTPWAGLVRPFLLESSSQFRTPGPLSLTSTAWATEFNEVKAMGRVDSAVRTPSQTHIALWWQSQPANTWNTVARALIEDPARGISLADGARLLAMQNMSAADAAINCWNDKYHYDFWRPWNAIPRAAEDGNAATAPDPTWTALITAPYPSHPSGHLCLDGAHLRALELFLGTDQVTFGAVSIAFPGEVRTFTSFSQALDEIVEARIWAGLHYRNADVQARALGKNVADYMAAHYFQKVGAG